MKREYGDYIEDRIDSIVLLWIFPERTKRQ